MLGKLFSMLVTGFLLLKLIESLELNHAVSVSIGRVVREGDSHKVCALPCDSGYVKNPGQLVAAVAQVCSPLPP